MVLVAGVLFTAQSREDDLRSLLVNCAIAFLENGQYDSSLISFQSAYREGMCEDCLYYYWAELYLAQGIIDTALALNLATKESCSSVLRAQVLRQRHIIYSALGWSEDAAKLLDSIAGHKRISRLIPMVKIESGLSYLRRTSRPVFYLPYDDIEPAITTEDKLPGGYVGTELLWRVPFGGSRMLHLGSEATLEQSHLAQPFALSSAGDSLLVEIKTYLRGVDLVGNTTLAYMLKNRNNYLGHYSTAHNFTISAASLWGAWFHYYALSSEFEQGEDVQNVTTVSLNGLTNFMVNEAVDLKVITRASMVKSDPFEFTYVPPINLFYYENGTFYSDSTFSSSVPITIPVQINSIKESLFFTTYIPEDRIAISLSKGVGFSFGKCKLSFDAGYGINYYTEKHHWYNLRFSSVYKATNVPLFGENQTTVVQTPSGDYYLAVDFDRPDRSFTLENEPLSIRFHEKRRIDNILQVSFSLMYELGRNSHLDLRANLRKSDTNLPKTAPVDIKPYIFQLRLHWVVQLNGSGNR